jgi:hypothetical protein
LELLPGWNPLASYEQSVVKDPLQSFLSEFVRPLNTNMSSLTSGLQVCVSCHNVSQGHLSAGHRASSYRGASLALVDLQRKRQRCDTIVRRNAAPTVCFAEPPNTVKLAGDDYYTILGVVRFCSTPMYVQDVVQTTLFAPFFFPSYRTFGLGQHTTIVVVTYSVTGLA